MTNAKKRSFQKKLSILAAAIATLALLITGTFAWFSGRINAENVFSGTKEDKPPVVLHDDFEAPTKDVYVENTGEGTVYVRVKFNELWDLTTSQKPNPIPANADWHTHKPGTVGAPGHLEHTAIAAGDDFHNNFKWTWGNGLTKKYIKADGSSSSGVYNNDADEIAAMELADPSRVGTTPMGNIVCADWYTSADFVDEYNDYFENPPYAPITSREDYIGWIVSADGWAYWSQPLKGGEATSLLLHSVTTEGMEDFDYYYVIDVILEAVDAADLQAMWIEGGPSVDPDNTALCDQADTLGLSALEFIKAIPVQ